ncbi:putative MFS multidrug transporter [Aureobasidium subglaciale]|nr:putative MFS multidrug transporter [Aureobasidium subglaciale]
MASSIPITLIDTHTKFKSPPDDDVVQTCSSRLKQDKDVQYLVTWKANDLDDPKKSSVLYKIWMVFVMSFGATVVSLYSTSYAPGLPGMEEEFAISQMVGLLGLTTYQLGMAVGSLLVAPLSEIYGRRPVYIVSMGLFTLLVIPCGLAENMEAILISRFFGAFSGAAMMVNAAGTVSDIISSQYIALAYSFWGIGPINGPVIGPIIGGFVFQYLGWRWNNWIVMIMSFCAFVALVVAKETYGPRILRQRAAAKRKATGDDRWWSQHDDSSSFSQVLRTNITRPIVMLVTEPICMFWDIYVALVYGVLYLCFVAYPLAFQEERGWSSGMTGLAYCGIGVGAMIIILAEPLLRRLINSHPKDLKTGQVSPEAPVSIVCIGGVLLAIGQLWFAWTCTKDVHWIVPILAGIPFGAGNACVFIYAISYLVRSYDIYAASAASGNAVLRSIVGGCLPLAGPSLYSTLGLRWGGTLLGLLEAACIPIPVIFYFYGHRIRARSRMVQLIAESKEENLDNV